MHIMSYFYTQHDQFTVMLFYGKIDEIFVLFYSNKPYYLLISRQYGLLNLTYSFFLLCNRTSEAVFCTIGKPLQLPE